MCCFLDLEHNIAMNHMRQILASILPPTIIAMILELACQLYCNFVFMNIIQGHFHLK